jgi:hypothetical protein
VDDGVDAGAVGEAGVDHRGGLVDAAADLADDLVDDAAQVGLVDEADVGLGELAAFSTKMSYGPLTMTSVTSGSFSSGSIGPYPSTSASRHLTVVQGRAQFLDDLEMQTAPKLLNRFGALTGEAGDLGGLGRCDPF